MKFNLARFVAVTAMLFILPVAGFSHEYPQKQMAQTFVSQIKITPDQFVRIHPAPNILRLTLKKTDKDDFAVLKAEADFGKPSHFLKAEYSNFKVEVLQDGELIFDGGLNDPNLVRHESMEPTGEWEHSDFLVADTTFLIRVPLKRPAQPILIKFYRMGDKR